MVLTGLSELSLTSGQIMVGSASGVPTNVAISGDATLSSLGTLTIANNAVTAAKINNNAVTAAKLESAADGELFIGNGTGFTKSTLTQGAGVTITNSAGTISISATGSGGDITEVSTGAGLSGGFTSGAGTLSVDASTIATGVSGLGYGGTGLSSVIGAGQFLYSNGSVYSAGTIAAVKNVTVTNVGGVYTIASTNPGGDITEVSAGNGLSGGFTNGAGTLSVSADTASHFQFNTGVLELKDTAVTPGTYTKVTVDSKGRATGSGTLAVSDLPPLGGTYYQQGGNSFGQTGTIGTADGNALTFNTNNSKRMTITAGGSVGIGIAAPAAMLDVAGAARFVDSALGCSAGTAGAFRFNGGAMEFCNNSNAWVQLAAGGSGENNTASNVALRVLGFLMLNQV